MRIQFPIYLFPLFIMACQSEQSAKTEKEEKQSNPEIVEGSEDFDFPEVDSLTNFPHSEFVLTLDEDLPKDKNVVYASTIALCWEGMKNRFNNKIDGIDKSSLLFRLDQFNKFKNTLAANEYKVNIEINPDQNTTTIHAEFSKTLPFSEPLTRFTKPMVFQGENVDQFGFTGFGHSTSILFYEEKSYGVCLFPTDENHQISIYYDGNETFTNFTTAYESMVKKYRNFAEKYPSHHWKQNFQYFDEVKIPVVSFNLISVLENLIGSEFQVEGQTHNIINAWQRNAFVLNENGAKVESEAETTEAAAEEEEEAEKPSPKRFIFDKPFYIFLKRTDADFPYFAAYINNTELLIKK